MRTPLCDVLGIEVPIFAFTHCRDVVAEVSRAGGMGVLGAVSFSPEQLELELRWLDEHVEGKPYGVDVIMPASYVGKEEELARRDRGDSIDISALRKMVPQEHRDFIEKLLDEYQVPELPASARSSGAGVLGMTESAGRALLEVAFEHPIALIANALGPPPKDIVDFAHERGMQVAALTGAVEHAVKHQQNGVDIIIAQGTEAGGHTGEIATMVLVPDVVDAVAPTPVLAAGGIATGRQAAAAIALGAEGIWTGSVWLGTEESELTPTVKEKVFAAGVRDTVRSRSLSGKPIRQLRTAWTEAWDGPDSPGTLPAPLQTIATNRAQARIAHFAHSSSSRARELVGTPVGQVIGRMNAPRKARDVFYELMEGFVDTVGRLEEILEASNKE